MTNAELIAALDKLDALFSDERRWTKHSYARNAAGIPTSDSDAVCWCLEGGCIEVGAFHELLPALGSTNRVCLSTWNDAPERTFADVKKLIADTRARLEAA